LWSKTSQHIEVKTCVKNRLNKGVEGRTGVWSEKTLTLEYFASGKNSVRPQLRYCLILEK